MRSLRWLVCGVLVGVCAQSIPVGKFLSILDKSLVYQLTHPTTNVNSIRFMIEDLRAYKDNLIRIARRLTLGRGYMMEHAKNLSLAESPGFLKDGLDYERMRGAFNLTASQLADIKILVTQIESSWTDFVRVANTTESTSNASDLPFFLMERAGRQIVESMAKPTQNETTRLFADLSNYYYGLGKLLKLFKLDHEKMCEKCRPMYEMEKPIFLRSYVNFALVKSAFQLDDAQAADFKRWVSKILFRWKIFTGYYESNNDLADRPNLNNYNLLVSTDNELRDIMSNPLPEKFPRLVELLDSFFLTLGLILRRNYNFREDIINHVRATYTSGPPLFLRKYINFKHLKDSFGLNEESFYRLRKKIFTVKNRWERMNVVQAVPERQELVNATDALDRTTHGLNR